jgi:hypothetical protein
MRARTVLAGSVAAALVAMGGIAVAGTTDDDAGILKDELHFREQALKDYTGGNKGGSAVNMVVVGHDDLGARGFNADVWTHDGYAYVGHWGFADWATGNNRFCPSGAASGVAVLDTRDATHPRRIATLQTRRGAPRRTSSCTRRATDASRGATSPSPESSPAPDQGMTSLPSADS